MKRVINKTDLVPGVKRSNNPHADRILEKERNPRPFDSPGNLHQGRLHKKKQHLAAISFDLEKAYHTSWKYGIMRDLYELGLRGRLQLFIRNFLSQRNFRVPMVSTFWSAKSIGRYSTRKHPISYSIVNKNQQYCQMPNSRLCHLLSRYPHEHNRTSTTTEYQQNK